MDDRIHIVQRAANGVAVAHVTGLQLDLRIEVRRASALRMHLRVEVVEDAHVPAVGEKPVGEMRADEPGAAGDQNLHGRA